MTRTKTKTSLGLFGIMSLMLFFGPVVWAQTAPSATLYFTPTALTREIGKTFSLKIGVNSPQTAINLAEVNLAFSPNFLEVMSVEKQGSIFKFWFTEPSFSNAKGTISFSGGVPSPGFMGSGLLLTINFRAKAQGNATIRINTAQVLANDGTGTNILQSPNQQASVVVVPALPGTVEPGQGDTFNLKVASTSHPDSNQVYNNQDVTVSWTWQPSVQGYSYILDQKPDTIPDDLSEGNFTATSYIDVEDGVWYFHIKAKNNQAWGTPQHFKIQINQTIGQPTPEQIPEQVFNPQYTQQPAVVYLQRDGFKFLGWQIPSEMIWLVLGFLVGTLIVILFIYFQTLRRLSKVRKDN